MEDLIQELERRREAALAMGGPERVRRQHAAGRLTVRERIAALIDEGSLYEIGLLAEPEIRRETTTPADAIVTGFALLGGRPLAVIGIDATVLAGSTAPTNMRKQNRVADLAGRKGIPLVVLADADGGRMPDVMGWRFSGLPFDFSTFLQSPSGHPPIPRCCAVMGPSFGDSALHAAGADFVVITKDSALALVGPSVVSAATGEEVTEQNLGGAELVAAQGLAHLMVDTEPEALAAIKRFLTYMPDSGDFAPPSSQPVVPTRKPDDLLKLVSTQPKRGYDMRQVIEAIADQGSLFPLRAENARSMITALARVEGRVTGFVANQPQQRAGVLDDQALDKELEFVELCDRFNIPLVFLHDTPGIMIGTDAERAGIVSHYEKVVARIATCGVPKVGVVIRKSYGGGNFAMGGGPTRPDFLFAWPSAELGFMAPEAGVRTVHRRLLEQTRAAEGQKAEEKLRQKLTDDWLHESEPWEAAARLYLDDVIDPRETRKVISTGIDFAWGSRRPPESHWRSSRA